MKKLLLLALCAFLSANADARTIYVNAKRPNNNGNGLKAATAKKTIQAAINIAKKGDVILVAAGTYAPIKTKNKKIKIKSVRGRGKTKIVKPADMGRQVALAQLGGAYGVYLDTYSKQTGSSGIWTKGTKSTLLGFTLDGKNRSVGDAGELIGVSGGTARECLLKGIGRSYADTYGGFPSFDNASVAVNAVLQDCVVEGNRGRLAPAEWMAVSTKKPGGSTFLRCKIQDNDLYAGFEASTLANCLVAGNAVQGELFYRGTIVNCTIAKNKAIGLWPDPPFSVSSKYANCILWNNCVVPPKKVRTVEGWDYYDVDGDCLAYRPANETSFFVDAFDALGNRESVEVTEETLSDYYPGWTKTECVYTTYAPGTAKKLHNVDSGNGYKYTNTTNKNPMFAKAYRLKGGSYCINKGRLTAEQRKLVGKKDLAGKKRFNGAIDRGCYER